MSKLHRRLGLATAVIALEAALIAGPAIAQVDQIEVTARKRVESLQDVPLAVTAFDAKTLERTYSDTLDEIDRFIPNVELSDIQFSGQSLGASIRGVSFADLEKTFEPAVGVSIDGVFLGSNTGAAIDIFDVEQVEVLRGPQGTLFGRNTIGGVINIRRTRPTGELGVRASTRIARNNTREYLVVANTPQIADMLSVKGYFFQDSNDTYSVNRATGDREPQADSISYGAAFLFEPNDAFDALVSVDIFNDDSFGTPTYNLTLPVNPQDDGPLGVPNFFLSGEGNFCDLTIDGAALGILPPGEALNGCAATSIDIATADDFRTHIREFPFRNFIDGVNVSAEINIDVGRFTLTSVTGYRESDEQLFEENLGAPLITGFAVPIPAPIFTAQRIQEYEQFSEELRIAGDLTDNITIVGGAYYLHTDFSLVGSNGPLGGLFGPVSEGTAFLGGLPISNSQTGQKLDAYAAFFDGTWQITDRFSFSGGARVTYEEKEFNISFLPCAGCATFGETTASDDWLQPTGRGIFQYQFTPDVMGFAGWSRGFRSGGFNGRAASLEGANRSYDPETVDNFEGGFRTEWLNNTVRINPTFFYTRYKDQQSPVIRAAADGSGTTETLTENVGRSRIWGIELEGLAQPTPELTFRLAAGYLNAEITEFLTLDTSLIDPSSPNFDPTATADDLPVVNVTEGRSVLRAPEFTVSVGGDYVKPIFDGNMQFTLSANYSWKDEFTTSPIIDLAGGRRDLIPSDGQADFSVTLETLNESGGNLSLTGYVKDAFHDGPGALGTTLEAGVFYFGAGRPTKVYGLEAVVTFN